MPSYTNPTELPIWIEPQQNLVSITGFAGYSNLQPQINTLANVYNTLNTQIISLNGNLNPFWFCETLHVKSL